MNDHEGLRRLEMAEWQAADPETHSELKGLYLEDMKDHRTAESLSNQGFVEITELKKGLRIRTKSWVGRITLGNFEIIIQPKIEKMPLLDLFRYGFQFKDTHLINRQILETKKNSVAEALILQLVNEVQNLLHRGLSRKYLRNKNHLVWPRGRIDIQGVARQAGIQGAGLPCIIHPKLADTSLNRTVLAGLKMAEYLSADRFLSSGCRRVITLFEESVNEVPLTRHLVEAALREQNRLTSHYDSLLNLIQILMNGRGMWMEGEKESVSIPGFLFDMNRLFQSVLFRFLRDNFLNFSVLGECALRGMMAYLPDYNPRNKKPPLPRPDFVIKDENTVVAVLDAKYRDLWNKDLPRDMLYQLGMYALGYPALRRVAILYPTTFPNAKEARIGIKDPVTSKPLSEIALRPVLLSKIVDLIEAGGLPSARREREKYARFMAFGS